MLFSGSIQKPNPAINSDFLCNTCKINVIKQINKMKESENENEVTQYMGESVAYEIAPGMTVEEVKAMFFDASALVETPQQIYRLDRAGHRYYYMFNEKGEPDFFPSITTLISQTLPTSEFLIKWIADKGYQRAEEYKNERAKYGTFMHGEYAEMLINKTYDLDNLRTRLLAYMETNNLPMEFVDYADDLRKNMLSLAQFIIDANVEPLAIEIPLIHPDYRFGCTLDLPCWMTLKGERFRANIDFKSGKNFYESNEVQLHAQKEAWNYHFPDCEIKRVFNWRPKEWREKPTYHLQEQTDSVNAEKLPHILAMAQIEDKKLENMLTICNGVIDLTKGITDNYKVFTLAELVKKKKTEKIPTESETADTIEEITKPDPESIYKKVSKTVKEKAKVTEPIKPPQKATRKQPVEEKEVIKANVPKEVEEPKKELKTSQKEVKPNLGTPGLDF